MTTLTPVPTPAPTQTGEISKKFHSVQHHPAKILQSQQTSSDKRFRQQQTPINLFQQPILTTNFDNQFRQLIPTTTDLHWSTTSNPATNIITDRHTITNCNNDKKQKKLSTVKKNCDKKPIKWIRRKRKNKIRSSTYTSKRDNKQLKQAQAVDRRDDGASSLKLSGNKYEQLPLTENCVVGGALPTFLKHCKPKGTESKSYNIWLNTMSFLKAASTNPYPRHNSNRKVRGVTPRKLGIVSVPNVDVVHLQRTVKNVTEVLGKFMTFD